MLSVTILHVGQTLVDETVRGGPFCDVATSANARENPATHVAARTIARTNNVSSWTCLRFTSITLQPADQGSQSPYSLRRVRRGCHVARESHYYYLAPPIDPQTTQIIRSIALGLTHGQVWSAEYGLYYIELWDTTGRRLAAFERSVDWFPRHPAPNDPEFRSYFAKSNIGAMREEPEGKLWVVMKVQTSEADRDPNVRREGGVSIGTYATMVEIIDTRTGQLIASKRFPIELSRGGAWLLGEDVIYGVRETAAGFNVLDVWRLRLKSAG